MIARSWRGWTKAQDAETYRRYVADTWVKDCKASPGSAGAFVFSRIVGDRAEIITLSLWDDEDSLRAFYGGDVNAPHFYPEDDKYIIDGDAQVVHYDAE